MENFLSRSGGIWAACVPDCGCYPLLAAPGYRGGVAVECVRPDLDIDDDSSGPYAAFVEAAAATGG